MNHEHIDCYRINYDVDGWRKSTDNGRINCLPFGAVLAIEALCNEVERLRDTQLLTAMKSLQSDMQTVADALIERENADHGCQLAGAAVMLGTWIDGIAAESGEGSKE